MGRSRLELHEILTGITPIVYFQPPTTTKMRFPCIVYKRDFAKSDHADNGPYRFTLRYMVTVIDEDVDSLLPPQVAALPQSSFNRFYTANDLNHDVYTLYF